MVVDSGGKVNRPTTSWVLCLERIHNRAYHMLLARIVEGLVVWGILEGFYAAAIRPLWASRLLLVLYLLVNCALVLPQRRRAVTPMLVWLDMIANLAPMAAATHWSGGLDSPILPIFVIKIGNYGLIYSVATGVRAAFATVFLLSGFQLTGHLGIGPSAELRLVPESTRQRLTLGFGTFLFVVGSYGAVRFFREIGDRERRLTQALEEQRRLSAQLLEDRERLRQLSQRLVDVSEATMQAVSRELHDDFGQAITAARLDLSRIERALPQYPELQRQLGEVRHQLGGILENVRNLSHMLRPAVLDDLGLIAALESYAVRFSERTGIHVEVQLPTVEPQLASEVQLALYRTLQEALTNVARHARARSVLVVLEHEHDRVRLRIRDDGQGFNLEQGGAGQKSTGFGITGMRERAELYGGRFFLTSSVGRGTEISVELPVSCPREGARGNGVETNYRAVG